MKTKLITVLLMTCLSLPFTASAAVPVIDLSAIAQLVNQVIEMQKQYQQMVKQYKAISGTSGKGALKLGDAIAHDKVVPGSWQDVVNAQKAGGKLGNKANYYESLIKTVDPAIFKTGDSRNARTYKLSAENTRAAFAVSDVLYETVEGHLKNIHELTKEIDNAETQKEAMDLNTRMVAENAMLQSAMAKLQAVQTNLLATTQNAANQSQAQRAELFQFNASKK